MSDVFSVHVTDDPKVVRVHPRGDIDMAAAPQLLDAVLSAGFVDGVRPVVIDFRDVRFMDSTGLSALVIAHRKLGQGQLSVANLPPTIAKIMSITGIDGLFPTADDSASTSWASSDGTRT